MCPDSPNSPDSPDSPNSPNKALFILFYRDLVQIVQTVQTVQIIQTVYIMKYNSYEIDEVRKAVDFYKTHDLTHKEVYEKFGIKRATYFSYYRMFGNEKYIGDPKMQTIRGDKNCTPIENKKEEKKIVHNIDEFFDNCKKDKIIVQKMKKDGKKEEKVEIHGGKKLVRLTAEDLIF